MALFDKNSKSSTDSAPPTAENSARLKASPDEIDKDEIRSEREAAEAAQARAAHAQRLEALEEELRGYELRGKTDRADQVREQIKLHTAASSKPRTTR